MARGRSTSSRSTRPRHGGVDDARDLREKAFFAPVNSRYKVYIIDEAHMVTTQGFNALLKLVEEPPEHLRFIFATTEPEKVIATIRSRTHHYPFRLIPPRLLSSYLSELCEKEGVGVEPAALPLVVRAGGGSARDSLSVLDQLIGGAGPAGVTHELASGAAGLHPRHAARRGRRRVRRQLTAAAVFGVVDKVIETGQDPRRFTEDLLRRLRDLVIVAAVPDATASGLIDVSEDQGERLVAQAARFGGADLSRAADLVATGLTEMRGATAPRLLLELICARVLLPGADHTTHGRRRPARPARAAGLDHRHAHRGGGSRSAPAPAASPEPAQDRPVPATPTAVGTPVPGPEPGRGGAGAGRRAHHPAAPATTAGVAGAATSRSSTYAASGPTSSSPTKARRRMAWIHLTQNCQVVASTATCSPWGSTTPAPATASSPAAAREWSAQAAIDVVGADWKIETIVDPGAQPEGAPTVTKARPTRRRPRQPRRPLRSPTPEPETPATPPAWAGDGGPPDPAPDAQRRQGGRPRGDPADPGQGVPRRTGPTTWPSPMRRQAVTTSTRTPTTSGARTCSRASSERP